jgi:phage-related baseplate assembly protein
LSLPEPSFIERDPVVVTADLKASWEAATGKALYPGQVESLLIDLIAYRETLVRIGIQEAAKQNLVAFAVAPMLDYLGELVGVVRLDGEADDQLRERIKLAPESYTTAGSRGSYIYHAKSADVSVVDVAVGSSSPGVVDIYPLTSLGLPSQAVLDAVMAACSAEDVRPLTDYVQVSLPVQTSFGISIVLTPYQWPDQETVRQQAADSLAALTTAAAAVLGRDITVSAIVAAAHLPGVYRVDVASPTADVVVAFNGFPVCTSIVVTLGDAVNG